MLVDRPPDIKDVAPHLDDGLIQKPRIAGFGTVATNDVGEQRTEPLLPLMDRLVADLDAPIGEDVFDIPKAQAETVI